MGTNIKTKLTLVLTTAAICTVYGAIWEVAPDASVQQAVDNAAPRDTIILLDGYHFDTVVLYGKPLTIGSLFLQDGDTEHIAATVVSPDELRPDTQSCFVYAYDEGDSNRLIGLTLQNGQGTYWSDAQRRAGGGAYVALDCRLEVRKCVFQYCRSSYGGGMAVIGVRWWPITRVDVMDSWFFDCYTDGYGGGIYASECSLLVDQSIFEFDTAEIGGTGGVNALGDYLRLTRSTFRGCYGSNGGVRCGADEAYISDCLFESNGALGAFTTHLSIGQGRADVFRSIFRNNSTGNIAVVMDGRDRKRFIGNVIENNVNERHTVTVLIGDRSDSEFAYNIIRNNTNPWGGALYTLSGSNVHIHHNYISGNISQDSTGPAVLWAVSGAAPIVDSNFITGHNGPTMDVMPPGTDTIEARWNYWGDPSGPYHPRLNPGGRGDTILSEMVRFIPWLTSPPDTSLPQEADDPRAPVIPRMWQLLEVYPNPFNSEISIIIAGFTGPSFRLTLHNLLGQEVAVIRSGNLTGGVIPYQVPASAASGIYFLRASDPTHTQSLKLALIR